MRIIAGRHKAKKLDFPKKDSIRPTSDMVKQAMFTTLYNKVENCLFLDLFCGSGQVGIEAVSRGAKKVVFVDIDFDAITVTKKNLRNIQGDFDILKMHYAPFLRASKEKFDIIFVDPPYEKSYYKEVMDLIVKHGVLAHDGIVICEHNIKEEIENENFNLIQRKKYGIKALSYFKNK